MQLVETHALQPAGQGDGVALGVAGRVAVTVDVGELDTDEVTEPVAVTVLDKVAVIVLVAVVEGDDDALAEVEPVPEEV